MSGQEKAVSEVSLANSALVTADARVLMVVSSNPSASPAVFDTTVLVPANTIPLTVGSTPANSTSMTITKGRTWTDGNYIYVATSNNVVKRATLSSF